MIVLDAARVFLEDAAGVRTVLMPEKLTPEGPHFRLTLNGFDTQGVDREELVLSGVLTADGDRPDYFLDSVIAASRALLPYRDGAHEFTVSEGFQATLTARREAPGRFIENEEGEQPFSYIESYRIGISYNPNKLP